MDCKAVFADLIKEKKEIPVLIYSKENCQGEYKEFNKNGDYSVVEIRSFIIPENYNVRFYKQNRQIYCDYRSSVWNPLVDNVLENFEHWRSSTGDEFQDSFDGVDSIDIENLGHRDLVLASSCVGLLENPVLGYNSSVEGVLNKRCEDLLDVFCSSPDGYHRDLCTHRIMYSEKVPEDNSVVNQRQWIYFVCIGIIVFFTVLTIVFTIRRKTTISKTNKKKFDYSKK
jgi:hypothetical protein